MQVCRCAYVLYVFCWFASLYCCQVLMFLSALYVTRYVPTTFVTPTNSVCTYGVHISREHLSAFFASPHLGAYFASPLQFNISLLTFSALTRPDSKGGHREQLSGSYGNSRALFLSPVIQTKHFRELSKRERKFPALACGACKNTGR